MHFILSPSVKNTNVSTVYFLPSVLVLFKITHQKTTSFDTSLTRKTSKKQYIYNKINNIIKWHTLCKTIIAF